MNHVTTKVFAGALAATMALACPASAELPTVDEIADALELSPVEKKSVQNGEFVSRTLKSSNERELAVGLVFMVPLSVAELRAEADKHLLVETDPETIAWSPISGDGSLDDFKTLNLEPDADTRAQAYLKAGPGEDLNLDKAEIAAFNAVKIPSGESAVQPVTAAVKNQLLGRFQAYHQKGLAGVSPYERGGGKTMAAADDLKSATESLSLLHKSLPSLYNVLLNYPSDKPQGLNENFMWSNYKAHGEPVYILTHSFSLADGDAYIVVQRQFYVSGSYNVGQALAAFVPTKGGTVVFYVNRTSTDQVTGFGSSTKRSIGSKVMASQLEDLYKKVRAKAEQDAK